jgi:protein-L-isoaspartate(D-aspartate) O-methyltransferase
LPIGDGQTISQPYMVAIMTQSLDLEGGEKILEIGTGSGFQAAVLGELAREVFSVERIFALIQKAEMRLRELGYKNIHCRLGDGSTGWREEAPFDGIIVTAGAPEVPAPLKSQLAEGGRLVIPVGSRHSQNLLKIRRVGGRFEEEDITGCVFVPLVGESGWREE